MTARSTKRTQTRRPQTVTLPSVDGVTVAAEVVDAEVTTTPEPTPAPKPADTPDATLSAFADPAPAAAAIKAEQSVATYEGRADDAQIRSAIACYRDARSMSYRQIAKAANISAATVSNRVILGALLAQVGSDLTLKVAHEIRRAARVVAPKISDLPEVLGDAPTGLAFVDYLGARKVAASEAASAKRRAARPNDGSKSEGTDSRTGETSETDDPSRVLVTPAEVLRLAAQVLTLGAHENDHSLAQAARALDAALTAYCDRIPEGRATLIGKPKRTSTPATPKPAARPRVKVADPAA